MNKEVSKQISYKNIKLNPDHKITQRNLTFGGFKFPAARGVPFGIMDICRRPGSFDLHIKFLDYQQHLLL
jgi:hypothetical protein